MKLKSVGIVVNGKAGSVSEQRFSRLMSAVDKQNIRVFLAKTTAEPGSATKLAAEMTKTGVDVIIAVGGDGTARQVLEGVRQSGTNCPMAVFPGGTGNLFVRSFFAVPQPEAFVQMLLNGRPQPIDVIGFNCLDVNGVAQSGISIVGIGVGDLSDAIVNSDQELKRRFGSLVYAINMLRAAVRFKPLNVSIDNGEVTRHESLATAFMLNVVPPKMSALSRGCNASDGLLDFVGLRGTKVRHLLKAGRSVTRGRPDLSESYCRLRAPNLTVESHRPMLLDIDGDAGPVTTKVTLQVIKGAAQMVLS